MTGASWRRWRVFVPVVLGNALVQAAAVIPFLTPALSPLFVLLAVVSIVSLVVATVLVLVAATGAPRLRAPWRVWVAASLAFVVIGVSALVSVPLILLTLTLAFVVLPGVAAGRDFAGFHAFTRAPWRAIALTLLTIVVLAALWIVALLLGFLVTGPLSAGVTWLLFGGAGVWLICAWTALIERSLAR